MLSASGDIERLINRIDQLISVIKIMVDDLSEISRSLKALIETEKPPVKAPSRIAEVQEAFSEDLRQMLDFRDVGEYIMIAPKRFLGSDNFAKIASTIRELGGEYISAGKDSHFRVPKR